MTYSCRKCGSENIVLVEYEWRNPEFYDGISEVECIDCKARFGRWSGLEIPDGFVESRYGERGIVKVTKKDEN